ncbi:MAG: hypothetical protein IT558_03840 [Alphaproteobacteria bacterium]|nr:hypothetical protein [Alphaproteobacteria bacterium]
MATHVLSDLSRILHLGPSFEGSVKPENPPHGHADAPALSIKEFKEQVPAGPFQQYTK